MRLVACDQGWKDFCPWETLCRRLTDTLEWLHFCLALLWSQACKWKASCIKTCLGLLSNQTAVFCVTWRTLASQTGRNCILFFWEQENHILAKLEIKPWFHAIHALSSWNFGKSIKLRDCASGLELASSRSVVWASGRRHLWSQTRKLHLADRLGIAAYRFRSLNHDSFVEACPVFGANYLGLPFRIHTFVTVRVPELEIDSWLQFSESSTREIIGFNPEILSGFEHGIIIYYINMLLYYNTLYILYYNRLYHIILHYIYNILL